MESKRKRVNDCSLAPKKLAALEKGDLTDCEFLVGPDDHVQKIRGIKFDLLVASEYFEGLLRSPLTPAGPIRIENVEPEVFKLVVEFTTCGQLVSKVTNLEQFLKLAAAADEYLIEELGNFCTEKLRELITVDNVWRVFDQNYLIKCISSVCAKVLSSKTGECLRKPAFRQIGERTLVEFLNLEEMNIKSEMELVSACIDYIKGREDERALFRRCALPHLRVLTLSADDFSKLAPFLEGHEQNLLALKISNPFQLKIDSPEDSILCKNATKRKLPSTMVTIDLPPITPDPSSLDDFALVGEKVNRRFSSSSQYGSKFYLILTSKVPIRITGFDIFGNIDEKLFNDSEMVTWMGFQESLSWKEGTTTVNVYVTGQKDGKEVKHMIFTFKDDDWPEYDTNLDWPVYARHLKPKKVFGTFAHFETSILVAKGEKAKIEVIQDHPCYIRKLLAKDAMVNNGDVLCRARHKQHPSVGAGGEERPKMGYHSMEMNLFKSVSYERV